MRQTLCLPMALRKFIGYSIGRENPVRFWQILSLGDEVENPRRPTQQLLKDRALGRRKRYRDNSGDLWRLALE